MLCPIIIALWKLENEHTMASSSCTIVLKKGEASSIDGVITVENLTQAVPYLPDPLTHVTIVVSPSDPTLFQPLHLATALSSLTVNGTVTIESTTSNNNDSFIPSSVAWVLAGLTPQSETTTGASSGSSCGTITRRWTATKLPSAVQAVALKTKNLNNNNKNENDASDDRMLLINEDDLLQEEGDWAPSLTAATKTAADEDDCGGREPCENCTCGRKEGAMPSQKQQRMATSDCGKCGMGDAFRCASCPFLGKPAFQQGQEHLVLEMQDDF